MPEAFDMMNGTWRLSSDMLSTVLDAIYKYVDVSCTCSLLDLTAIGSFRFFISIG